VLFGLLVLLMAENSGWREEGGRSKVQRREEGGGSRECVPSLNF
jgi:hypothetical protein